jgi:hypothetical protein
MEIIIRQMKMQRFKFNYGEQTRNRPDLIELSPISSNDDDDIFADARIKTSRTVSIITENNNQKRNSDEHEEILLNNSTGNNESELILSNLFLISSASSTGDAQEKQARSYELEFR